MNATHLDLIATFFLVLPVALVALADAAARVVR